MVGAEVSTSIDQHHRTFWKLLTVCSQPQPRRQAEPSFTNKTVPSAPANPNTYSHTCWQRYHHLKITVLFLLFTALIKATGKTSLHILSLWPSDVSAHIDNSKRKKDTVFIRKYPASWLICTNCSHIGCYYYGCCCCTRGEKAGRHRATGKRHRWKAHSSVYDSAPLLNPRKTEQSHTLSWTDLWMWNR